MTDARPPLALETKPAARVDAGAAAPALMGIVYGVAAYVMWGLVPLYWKSIASVTAQEILLYRIVFTVPFVGALITLWGRWAGVRVALRDPRALRVLGLSAALIAFNWGLFIWAVNAGRILETSLGYFINPLMSIALGVAVLSEKMSRVQILAVVIATLAVINHTIALGALPWVSLLLAVTFAIYGLIRKQISTSSLEALFVETLLMAPLALLYGLYLSGNQGLAIIEVDPLTALLLMGAGPVTAIPLIVFVVAIRRVRLSTIGFLQYISPTLTFLLGTLVYGEAFELSHAITFALIWCALIMISIEALWRETLKPAVKAQV